jgi:hypothetical protein
MATFALIHGGGDVGWYWHLVEAELCRHGHDAVAPDLPCDNDAASLDDYADTVVDAIGGGGARHHALEADRPELARPILPCWVTLANSVRRTTGYTGCWRRGKVRMPRP